MAKKSVVNRIGEFAGDALNTRDAVKAVAGRGVDNLLTAQTTALMAPAKALENVAADFGAGFNTARPSAAAAPAPGPNQMNSGKIRRAAPAPAAKPAATAQPAATKPAAAPVARREAPAPARAVSQPAAQPSAIRITPTQGFDTAIRRPAAGGGDEFNPSRELYERAQMLLAQGANEGSGNFRDRMKAAIARGQGKRLLEASRGFMAEEGAMTRNMQDNDAAMARTQLTESGQDRRAVANNENELLRTQMTGRAQLANTELSSQLARNNKRDEMVLDEMRLSKRTDTAYKGALAREAEGRSAGAQQIQQLQQVLATAAPGSPEYVTAAQRLTAIQGRTDPGQNAMFQLATKALTDPLAASQFSPEQLQILQTFMARGGGMEGFADGGMIPAQPDMAAMGAPNIQPQINLVNEYRSYASAAARLGATPVSFDQYSTMKVNAAPPVAGYANGGLIEEPSLIGFAKYALNGGRLPNEMPQQSQQSQPATSRPANEPFAVQSAVSAITNRKRQMEEAMGYAQGGPVAVGGRQVVGAGNGKSDSLPAIIDGERPAALSTGEYVFPVEAVRHFGLDKLNKMVEAARQTPTK
jgi:hypothetical protein